MDGLVTAKEVANILECSRQHIDYLMEKKRLTPVSTIYPRWYFDKDEVLLLKETMKPISDSNQ